MVFVVFQRYSDAKILEYKGKPIGELSPHVYAISNEAYANMWKNDNNQVVLISGESGYVRKIKDLIY